MIIYFVRHGEGHHNASDLYSHPDFELTEKGRGQAAAAAERVKHLPIELIVASPYKRTVQTMEIINQVIDKPVEFSDLAVEVKRPSEISGKNRNDPEVAAIKKQLDDNFHLRNWHYSDEENFFDLKGRAQKFLKYLETFKDKQHILVVSHAVFIRMVILVMILKDEITPQGFLNVYETMHLATSGLTVCEKNEKGWRLITWNDQSHLGE